MSSLKFLAKGITLFFLFLQLPLLAQVEDDPDADEEDEKRIINYNNDDFKGFSIGLNFGVHFAHKSSATFYTGNRFITPNDICIFLPCAGVAVNEPVYNTLVEEIGGFQFVLEDWGNDLRYDPALTLGLNLRYRLGAFTTIQTDLTYANLRAQGVIVLNVDRPNPNGTADDYFESYPIWGKEQRFTLTPGVQLYLSDPSDFVPYFDIGAVITSTRVTENRFRVGNREYSILRPQTLNGQIINQNQQTANGFGAYSGLGAVIKFEKVLVDFGYRASLEKVPFRRLDPEFADQDKRSLHHSITLKFIYSR